MARLGPKKQRLTRAEWKAQKHAMKVAAAESAVLDSAATKEKEAHKRLQAVQEHAELLAKRSARPAGDAEGASPASRARKKSRNLRPF